MKKIFVLVFVLALALSVTACTSKEAEVGQCPDCVCNCICPEPERVVIQQPEKVAERTIQCKAEPIGTPVQVVGECKFCTINYVYDPAGKNPGDVFIVGDKPMEYRIGAYVYQYLFPEDFETCIKAQDFYTDPGYTPIWVDAD